MAVRRLKLRGGGGAVRGSEGHPDNDDEGHISLERKRAPARKKGTFFNDYQGGGPARYGPI